MSYLVLARKYRPQRFEDLVGQEHVARTLANAFALGRVHHAFLFTGARGVGKTSAARILAKALCCETGPTATPCGTCDSCREITSGQSVDVLEIDGASNTGVEDVRTLRENIRYAPARGRRKVYIIDEVHMLSSSAFNALLKTLEEPPDHAVFVFATTEVHKIPSTILSRCQRFDFKLISTPRLVEHLGHILTTEGIAFEAEGLRLLARQAAGSARDSLSLLDQVIAYVGDAVLTRDRVAEVLGVADRRLLVALAEAVLGRQAGTALRLFAEAVDRGVDLTQLARAFLSFLHDCELIGLLEEPGGIVDATPEEIVESRALVTGAGKGLLGALFDRWSRAVEEGGRSQSARLIFEMALVDLCATEPLLPLGDLLKRLEDLEGRLGGARGPGPAPAGEPRSGGGGSRAAAASPVRALPVGGDPGCLVNPGSGARPSPAPAAPPGSIEEAWRRVRAKFDQRPSLAAALDHAELRSLTGGRATLRFPERLALDQTEKNRAEVERAFAEVMGAVVRLDLEQGVAVASAAVQSEVRREADALAADRKRREEEARQHPMIRKAQELFGVTAREIKTP